MTGLRPTSTRFLLAAAAQVLFRGEADMNRQARLSGSAENDPQQTYLSGNSRDNSARNCQDGAPVGLVTL
jgi:hypothetical protein